MARVLEGSEEDFRRLVLRYERPIFSLIVRMVRDAGLAEDLSQEVFLKAYRALETYDPTRRFSSWLFKIAHNATIDRLRRRELATVPLESAGEEGTDFTALVADPASPPPDRRVERGDLARALDDAMRRLRPAYQEVILLRHREGLSYQEIAEVTGANLGTVKTNLHRARKELAGILRRAGFSAEE